MAPTRHFATCGAKKSAKHYINMAPLWNKLIPLINLIDDGIKEASLKLKEKQDESLEIYTAVKEIQNSPGMPAKNCNILTHSSRTFGIKLYTMNIEKKE